MKNPKTTLSIIISVITTAQTLLTDNAEVLGINSKTLTIVSLLVTLVSLVWKEQKPEESAFTLLARHIGIRPKKRKK